MIIGSDSKSRCTTLGSDLEAGTPLLTSKHSKTAGILLAALAVSGTASADQYRYSAYDKPDPFFPTLFVAVPSEAVHPLQTYPLDRLVVVGIILGRSPTALVSLNHSAENNPSFLVRVGDKIGIKSGTIVSILKDRIIVREPLDSGENREFSRFQDSALMLRLRPSQAPADLITDLSGQNKKTSKGLTEALVEDVMPKGMSQMPLPSAHLSKGGDGRTSSTGSSKAGSAGSNGATPFSDTGFVIPSEGSNSSLEETSSPGLNSSSWSQPGSTSSSPSGNSVFGNSVFGGGVQALPPRRAGASGSSPVTAPVPFNQSTRGISTQAIPIQTTPMSAGGSSAPIR